MWARLLLLLAVVPGCVHDELVRCGDDLCAATDTCDTARGICVPPNGLSIERSIEIPNALCGLSTGHTLTVRNVSSQPVAYDTILSDVGVEAIPARGTFMPGDTDLQLRVDTPLDSVAGEVIKGSLLIPVGTEVMRRDVSVTPTGAILSVSSHSVDFGENPVASPVTSTVTYANSGNLAVNLAASLPPSNVFGLAGSSTIHLEPGDSRSVALTFASNVQAPYTSQLTITPDATLCQPPLDTIPVTGAVTTSAILVSTFALDFGDIICGQASTMQSLTVTSTNASAQDVTVAVGGTDASIFTSSSAGFSLPGMAMQTFDVTRAVMPIGTMPGMKTAELDLQATLGTSVVTPKTVVLAVNLKAPYVTAQEGCADFPLIPPHSVASFQVHIVNSGTAPAAVNATRNPLYPTVNVSPASFQIAPNGTQVLTVSFNNTSNGYADLSGIKLALVGTANACSLPFDIFACGAMN